MATWYSIKNQLEGGYVKARNELERFFTSIITSYGCIDIWYRNISSDSNIIECRIFYLQKDSTFNATDLGRALNSWERVNERPQYWLQLEGTVSEIRASIVSFLPQLSRLHSEKRHGEWNFGAEQPFEGQGTIISTDGSGNTIITGRFGDVLLNSDGESIDWEDITWSFDGCNPTATAPPADQVCFIDPGTLIKQCQPVGDDLGTCVCGECCGDYTAELITEADCTANSCGETNSQWISTKDFTNFTSARWDNYFSCPTCVGTCVTGNCDDGFTATYPVTEDACTGNWYKGQDLSSQPASYWEGIYGCNTIELGCCVIGTDCFNWDVSVTSSAACTARASELGLPVDSFTPNQLAQSGCTLEDVREDKGCLDIPLTITMTVTYELTLGCHVAPGSVGGNTQLPGEMGAHLGWFVPCDIDVDCFSTNSCECQNDDTLFIQAVTPGSNHTHSNFYNQEGEGGGCTGFLYPDNCRQINWNTEFGSFSAYIANFSLNNYSSSRSADGYTATVVYTFERDPDYNGNDEEVQRYVYKENTAELVGFARKWATVTSNRLCCFSGAPTHYWYQPEITLNPKIVSTTTANSNLLRFVNKKTGQVSYDGRIGAFSGDSSLTFSSLESSPSQSGFSENAGLNPFDQGWRQSSDPVPDVEIGNPISFEVAAPYGEGTKVNTFGYTINDVHVEYGSVYNTLTRQFIESCKVTVAVAES